MKRWIGGASGLGAASVVVMMALMPAASAGIGHNALPTGTTWYPSTNGFLNGCAGAAYKAPGFSAKTGAGHWQAKTTAKSCPKSRGGPATNSEAQAYGTIYVKTPVKLKSGTNGVNVTWNAKVAIATNAVFKGVPPPCPTNTQNYSYNFGYTWYNYSFTQQLCDVESIAQINAFAYLIDTTSNQYFFPSNYWGSGLGVYNISGYQTYWYAFAVTYSNSSYWSYNYSYSFAQNMTWGSPGAISGTFLPTFFINGTGAFVSTDKYEVFTYFENYDAAQVVQYKSAHAAATLNGATLGNHEDLQSITVW